MVQRVTIKIAETAAIVVDVTDKMVSDYRECRRRSEIQGEDGGDCNRCSLDTSQGLDFGLCELAAVAAAIEAAEQ